jgi:hypothetical protein
LQFVVHIQERDACDGFMLAAGLPGEQNRQFARPAGNRFLLILGTPRATS